MHFYISFSLYFFKVIVMKFIFNFLLLIIMYHYTITLIFTHFLVLIVMITTNYLIILNLLIFHSNFIEFLLKLCEIIIFFYDLPQSYFF